VKVTIIATGFGGAVMEPPVQVLPREQFFAERAGGGDPESEVPPGTGVTVASAAPTPIPEPTPEPEPVPEPEPEFEDELDVPAYLRQGKSLS